MSETILKIENLSKQYRLGLVGSGTMSDDLKRWWFKILGKEDPFLKIGDVNNRATKGESDYVWSLRDINFEVKKGEVLGIIGKNGAGKSTLLKILSKVTGPTTGSIKSNGRIASLLEVGTGFHPEMTGRENIFLNGAILGMTKKEIASKLDEIVEFSGCQRYIDTPTKRYSSGMTVRLAFAVAAFLEPDILIVDEVLAVGDAEFQKKAIGKMQDISNTDGRTVLFVSHNMAAVKNLCTRAIVLESGTAVFEGNVNDSIDFYLGIGSELESMSLGDRTDRKGNQKLKLVNVDFYSDKNTLISDIISGSSLRIVFDLQRNDLPIDKNIFVTVEFINTDMVSVLKYVNDEMGFSFSDLTQKLRFELLIPNLNLRAGGCSLRVVISEIDTAPNNFIDVIEDVAFLNILAGDLWNTGKPNRGGTVAVFPGEFKV